MTRHPKEDFSKVRLGDIRLDKRLIKFVTQCTERSEHSILSNTGSRNDAKTAYNMLSNKKFKLNILADSVRESVFERMSGTVILIQDTTDINLNGHKKTKGLGYSSEHTKGVKVHSCLAVSGDGVPIGLVSQSYTTRETAKSVLSDAEKKKLSIEEKESYRWIHTLLESTQHKSQDTHFITVADREADIYELYTEAIVHNTDFIIRVAQDRLLEDNEKIFTHIRNKQSSGTVEVQIPRNSHKGRLERPATMEVAFDKVVVKKPVRLKKNNIAKSVTVNVVRITEVNPPEGIEPVEWILITSLPLETITDAMQIVYYYQLRWLIERFHYVLKSGLGAEKIQQHTYEKIIAMIFIYSVISVYIMGITHMGRVEPELPCTVFFDDTEWKYLYRFTHKMQEPPEKPYSLAKAVEYLGQLGSYKRNQSDGPPGVKSIWKGLFRLYSTINILMGQV